MSRPTIYCQSPAAFDSLTEPVSPCIQITANLPIVAVRPSIGDQSCAHGSKQDYSSNWKLMSWLTWEMCHSLWHVLSTPLGHTVDALKGQHESALRMLLSLDVLVPDD
jgi:hypothetical protein